MSLYPSTGKQIFKQTETDIQDLSQREIEVVTGTLQSQPFSGFFFRKTKAILNTAG